MQAAPANLLLDRLKQRASDDVVLESDGRIVTAGQLLSDIDEAAASFINMGIDRLGILADNSSAWITTDLACQSAGICVLPLPTFFSESQLLHSMNRVGIDAVLTDNPGRLADLFGSQINMAGKQPVDGLELMRLANKQAPELPEGTQKITFTSGSTGTPKGVCLGVDHQLRVANALDLTLQISAPRHLCLLPLSTLLENVGGAHYALLAGGTVFTPKDTDTGFSGSAGLDMPRMLETISRHRPTTLILIPQMLVGLVAALENGWQLPAELEFAAVGGAKVAAGLLRRARELGLPVYEGYGLSETGSVACLNVPGNDHIGSVGRPLPHIRIEARSAVLNISGNTFLGYLGDPDSWNKQSVDTGDIGEIDSEGFVSLQGRSKNILITSFGRNVSPEWVESELLYHPEVLQCIVFGDARPHCVALIAAAAEVSNSELKTIIENVNESLPDYARIRHWHSLPTPLSIADGLYTENGRPRRAIIEERFGTEIDDLYMDKQFQTQARHQLQSRTVLA